jgi:competence protein ComFC
LLEKVHIDKYNSKTKFFSEHIYLFKYEDFIRKLIIQYKFNDKSYINDFFFNRLIKNKKICEIIKCYDIIIPVPIHNKRRRQRGYNQTELIAIKISNTINQIEYENILVKEKNIISQSKLNKEQRIKNVKDVYKINNKIKAEKLQTLKQKNILILDDVFTTGATASECAKALQCLMPNKIGILTLAKDYVNK